MLRKLPILLCMLALIISFSLDYTIERDINLTLTPIQKDKNTAIYAGYSEDGTISDYVVTYLKKLKEIAPNIIYVTDNKISKRELNKIRPYINHVIAQRHEEYDWGSYKRGYNWLMSQNLPRHPSEPNGEVKGSLNYLNNNDTASAPINKPLNCHPSICDEQIVKGSSDYLNNNDNTSAPINKPLNCHPSICDEQIVKGSSDYLNNDHALAHPHPPLLILANDSTITLTDSFAPLLADMQQKQADVYGITANQDGTYHIQSYFMILNNKAYRDKNFANYLNNVKKEKDGLTVAYRYEVPFTQYMQSLGYKTATYIPYESLSHLRLNDKNCYPLTLISQYNMPVLKMRTFTNRLTVQEPRRLVFSWLKKHKNQAYKELIKHLKKINSPYLSENK